MGVALVEGWGLQAALRLSPSPSPPLDAFLHHTRAQYMHTSCFTSPACALPHARSAPPSVPHRPASRTSGRPAPAPGARLPAAAAASPAAGPYCCCCCCYWAPSLALRAVGPAACPLQGELGKVCQRLEDRPQHHTLPANTLTLSATWRDRFMMALWSANTVPQRAGVGNVGTTALMRPRRWPQAAMAH